MRGFRKAASVRNPPACRRLSLSRQTSVFRSLFEAQGSALSEWCSGMHGRGQGCLRGQHYLCRIMMFETDPAMSRSAIRPKTIAARISRWSSCLTSRWTHPQLSGSGFLGGPTYWGLPLINLHPVAHPSASKGRPLRHIACSTTASFRATATFARLNPMRSRNLRPQRRRALSLLDRVRMWAAAS